MKLILKRSLRLLDSSSVSGLSGFGKIFNPGVYDVNLVSVPHPSFNGKWIQICETCFGISLRFLEQFNLKDEDSLIQLVNDSNKLDYIGPLVVEDSKTKS